MPAPDDRVAGMGPGSTGPEPAGMGEGIAGDTSAAPKGVRAGSSRPLPTVLLIVAAALLLARIGTGAFESRHPPDLPDLVQWRPIAEGEAQARRELKPVLYDFTADWCAPCRLMKREVFADRTAAKTIGMAYVPVRVLDRVQEEGRNAPEVAVLQERYHVQSFPTLVVVPAEGGEPQRLEGYPGRAETIQWLSRSGFRMSVRMGGTELPHVEDSSATRRP